MITTDIGYDISLTTFYNLVDEKVGVETSNGESSSTILIDDPSNLLLNTTSNIGSEKGGIIIDPELSLLDLYPGYGAMSTTLSLFVSLLRINLVMG